MRALVLIALLAAPAAAETRFDLPPGAVETGRVVEANTSHLLPTARFTPAYQPGLALEGQVVIRAWQLPLDRADTLSVFQTLRDQVEARGFRILHQCDTRACGGYDFRFHARVLPPPEMEVDLGSFRYLSAASREDEPRHIGILVSRSVRGGHVQITEVTPVETAVEVAVEAPAAPPVSGDLGTLETIGRAVLEAVTFEAGSTALTEDARAEVADLAAFLEERPEFSIIIVGHSDNVGSLEANIRVSRARAAAVRDALIAEFGIGAERITAEGVGFLAPRALNTTAEGQALNRRVEVVLR